MPLHGLLPKPLPADMLMGTKATPQELQPS